MRWKLFLFTLLTSGWAWAGGTIEHRVGSGGGSVKFNVGSGGGQVKYSLGLTEPINFAFISASSNTVGVSWTTHDLTPAPTNYTVQVSTNSNFAATLVSSDTANLTSTTTATLLVNRVYYGRVRAIAPVFDPSPWSGVRSSATLAVVPVTVVSTWTGVTSSSLTMNWSKGDNPASTLFEAQLSTVSGLGSGTILSSSTSNENAGFTGLTSGGTYYGQVRAVSVVGIPTSFLSVGSTVTIASSGPQFVQSSCSIAGVTDPISLTFNSAVTVGNSIFVGPVTTGEGHLVGSVVDNKSNTYTQRSTSPGTSSELSIYDSLSVTTGGSGFTVTFDASGTGGGVQMCMAEFSGVTSFGQQTTATGTGTAVDSGNLTEAVTALWIGGMTHEGGTTSLTETGGWSLIGEVETATIMPLSMTYLISAAVTDSATWTAGTSVTWRSCISTYR